MIVIGIDPHKSTHTATAIDPGTNADIGTIRIDAALGQYKQLLKWAGQWPQRRWAVENASGLGHHIALWLVSNGESVVDVPATATARVRGTFPRWATQERSHRCSCPRHRSPPSKATHTH